MIDHLSASAVKKWRECPKSFWYKYVERQEIPEKEDPEHFNIGNVVHESIEEVLKEHPDVRDEDELLTLLREKKRDNEIETENKSEEQVQSCLEMAATYISKYIGDVHHTEERWEMNYEKYDIEFVGYSDLVADIHRDGEVLESVIVDWKTGKETSVWKEKIQGGTYLELHKDKYGFYPDAIEFVYLNEGTKSTHPRVVEGEVMWNERENKYWEEIESDVNDIVRADRNGIFPAEGGGSTCYFCDYKYVCSDYVGGEKVQPHHISPI